MNFQLVFEVSKLERGRTNILSPLPVYENERKKEEDLDFVKGARPDKIVGSRLPIF